MMILLRFRYDPYGPAPTHPASAGYPGSEYGTYHRAPSRAGSHYGPAPGPAAPPSERAGYPGSYPAGPGGDYPLPPPPPGAGSAVPPQGFHPPPPSDAGEL